MVECTSPVAMSRTKDECDLRRLVPASAAEVTIAMPEQAGEGWPLLQSQSFKRAVELVELANDRGSFRQSHQRTAAATDTVEITIDGSDSSMSKAAVGSQVSSSDGWGMGLIAGQASTTTTSGSAMGERGNSEVNSALRPGPSQREGAAHPDGDDEATALLLTASFPAVESPVSKATGPPALVPLLTPDVAPVASSPPRDVDHHRPLSPLSRSACTCIGGIDRGSGARDAGSSDVPAVDERAGSARNELFQIEEVTVAEEGEHSPRASDAEGDPARMRACGLLGGGAGSAHQESAAAGRRRRGGGRRRRRRAEAQRGAAITAVDGESDEGAEGGVESRRPLSVVIHGPGASFFVGTELIAAGVKHGADSAIANADVQADAGMRPGSERAEAIEAERGEDDDEYDDSEYGSEEESEEEGERRRRRGRRRIQVIIDECRCGLGAVMRWGRSRRDTWRGRGGSTSNGPATSAAGEGDTSDSEYTDSDYSERDPLEGGDGRLSGDEECDSSEGYCMECERSCDEQPGPGGVAHGDGGGSGERDGGESDGSAASGESYSSGSSAAESKASADIAGAALLDFQFAPLLEPTSQSEGDMWVEAVHVVLPPPPVGVRGGWEGVDVSGMEAIFDPRCTRWFQRVKRLFIALLLLGSIFYIISFVAGVLANRGSSTPQPLPPPDQAGAGGSSSSSSSGGDSSPGLGRSFDYVSHAMLTSSNIWVAMAYLVLYLSLDMIGFAGAILENVSLLTLYIVVELIIALISALEALRPFLLFRLLVILLALRLRYSALKVEDAERRLFSRLMGRPMPPPNRRTWLARLGIFPGTLSAMVRHAPLSRFQLRGRPWYAELVRLHHLRSQHLALLQRQQQQRQEERRREEEEEERRGREGEGQSLRRGQRQQRRQRRRERHVRAQQRQRRTERQQQGSGQGRGGEEASGRGEESDGRQERGAGVEGMLVVQQQQQPGVQEEERGQIELVIEGVGRNGEEVSGGSMDDGGMEAGDAIVVQDRSEPSTPSNHQQHQQQHHTTRQCGAHPHCRHHRHHHPCQDQRSGACSQPLLEQQEQQQQQGEEKESSARDVFAGDAISQQQPRREQEEHEMVQGEREQQGGQQEAQDRGAPLCAALALNEIEPQAPVEAGEVAAIVPAAEGKDEEEEEEEEEEGEGERRSEAIMAAHLLLPPPFPLVPHLSVPRTPSSSLPPSRSVSLTHLTPTPDTPAPPLPPADDPHPSSLPATPIPATSLMSAPLPPATNI